MRSTILITAFILFAFPPAMAQMITSSTPADLQAAVIKSDGTEIFLTSKNMLVKYDGLNMTGELAISSIRTEDPDIKLLLDSARYEKIYISGLIPEGKFVFHDAVNEQFTVEAELVYGEIKNRIIIHYTLSNRKTSLSNTFEITCTGKLSLKDDLGLSADLKLMDDVSFLFFHNVQTKSY